MIIRMRKDAGKMLAWRVSDHFRFQGLKVFVENGGRQLSLAVFNSEDDSEDYFSTNGLVGIATTSKGNKYFVENRGKFVPSEKYFPE